MRYTLTLTLLAVCPAGLAQNTSVTPIGAMAVFSQVDNLAPKFVDLPASAKATPATPLAAVVEQPLRARAVNHARSKASLRLIDGLPAVRIYEAGFTDAAPWRRSLGTTDASRDVGRSLRPHAWLLRFDGTPGQRVRVHVRLRSNVQGPAQVSGTARVDVGNDRSFEFDEKLDGFRYLGNPSVTLGASGRLEIRIETSALLRATAAKASSYSMAFDVSLEPVQGQVAAFAPYGPLCGADTYGISWVTGNQRNARLVLDNAAANAPAAILFGIDRQNITLPGATCTLLTTPGAILPTRTDRAGRSIDDLPPFDIRVRFDIRIQYATLGPGGIDFGKGLRFRSWMASERPYDHFDVNHVISTGQSLALGGLGSPVLSTTQPFNNLMFDNGVRGQSLRLAPLVESFWETMSSGLASTASELHRRQYNNRRAQPPRQGHDILVSLSASPGMPYSQLKRGTPVFQTALSQQRLGQYVADQQNKSYLVRCVTTVHGEEDHQLYNSTYSRDLLEWQKDYETELRQRGMTRPIPMLMSQMSSHSSFSSAWSFIPTEQLKAAEQAPRKLILVGPKYIFDYVKDGVHLTSRSYRYMGEYYGKVYAHLFLEGATWTPLRPLTVTRQDAVIRVRFHVPEPPLVFDTSIVVDPGNFGFEYTDKSPNPPVIKTVRLVDEDTVEIILSRAPLPAANGLVRYAYTGIPLAKSGPQTGARGNLRDSDQTPSFFNSPLYNWAVHFSKPVQ